MDFIGRNVTTLLVVINVALFLLETRDGGSSNTRVALKYGAQYGPYVRKGQYYRLFVSMFLHFGAYHLLFNLYALSVLGPAVEYVCGPAAFLGIYLLSGLAGNILTYVVEKRTGRERISAGASGCTTTTARASSSTAS